MNIEVKISDLNKLYFLEIDTNKNVATIHSKINNDIKYDYHVEVKSKLLVEIVDELNNVKVDNEVISGKKALELSEDNRFKDVVKGIINSIKNKNLFLTITSLFSKFKSELKTDISISEIVKLILSETVDLDKWSLIIK